MIRPSGSRSSPYNSVLSFCSPRSTLTRAKHIKRKGGILPFSQYRRNNARKAKADKNDFEKEEEEKKDDNMQTYVDVYTPLLNKRLSQLRADLLEEQMKLPPNPNLNPMEVITLLLQELRHDNASSKTLLPDSGFRILLRTSTLYWQSILRQSIAAPVDATEEQLVSALSSAMSRPNNQYQILVGGSDDCENYQLYFPGDVFEYEEGKAWVESQLRHVEDGKLLAIVAWSFVQRESEGSWLVDSIDWQDFRDEFRPGIGREEWMRICG